MQLRHGDLISILEGPAMPAGTTVRFALGGVLLGVALVALVFTLTRRGTPETLITNSAAPSAEGGTVTVYVGGAVAHPGLYTLPRGERVEAALTAAGGLAPDAAPDGLNRAVRLRDEAQIIVPRKGEPTATAPRPAANAPAPDAPTPGAGTRIAPTPTPAGPININAASAADLALLPGVGPKLAQEIIDYRTAHGRFASPADLAQVKGISDRMVASWENLITCGP
jgi:competence protein ComEA